eukprot:CAMPEP_0195507694 /NCGR_PEP_ID=MMETSP0794_2-20130614/1089_1 /TAXON_ID=515487 /ORGANISM="Stephanopyxis turris, Strain CCMP 815" /LENGTH=237 /DNA_ID=CAMNT_0040634457 /DNA_START=88 /DNA_END=801 /DNA_ORIENTATION=-
MGQVCSFCDPNKDEKTKNSDVFDQLGGSRTNNKNGQNDQIDPNADPIHTNNNDQEKNLSDQRKQGQIDAEIERQRAMREEQARLDCIVTTAGRDMVSVNRRDGYYDPGYAAAVAQNLRKNGVLASLPLSTDSNSTFIQPSQHQEHANNAKSAIQRSSNLFGGKVPNSAVRNLGEVTELLSRGRWEGIELGQKGYGLGGCGGEDPDFYLDDCAEGFLAMMVPTKERFQGLGPIVQNLP